MRPKAVIFAALLTMLAVTAATSMAAGNQHRRHASRHHPVAAEPQGQIACTVGGCERIPPACTPVPGRTWRGTPTGYDVIVCPPGGAR